MTFLALLLACACAGATGVMFPTGGWYQALRKPAWTPPNWAFPVVWTTLYVLMAWAAARVAGTGTPLAAHALALWALQIVANALWTPTVFGAHRLRAGLAVIALLWVAVLLTTIAFWRVSALSGVLMLPYLAWVSLASALNVSLVRLNPEA